MKYIMIFGILFITQVRTSEVTDFCSNGPPGMYCKNNLSGFYWCLESASQSAFFACPAGTQCNCFVGPNCQSVPTIGGGSPCGYVPNLPKYPVI